MTRASALSAAFLAGSIVGAVYSVPATANTLDFTFTIDNTYFIPANGFPSGVPGLVVGDITLQGSGTSYSASAIDITSIATGGPGSTGPYTIDPSGSNAFTVTGGNTITNANLIGVTKIMLGLNWSLAAGGFANWQSAGGCNASDPASGGCRVVGSSPQALGQPQSFGTLAFALDTEPPTPAPLPAAFPLFATGLGVMGLFGWCRNRKRTTAFATV